MPTRRDVLQWLAATPLVAAATRLDGASASHHDICVYGGTAAGVVAAVQARKLGHSVLLLEPGDHLGGLSAGGLGATDAGRRGAIGGLSRAFYTAVEEHYRETYGADSEQHRACSGGFRFEPHVAESIFDRWLADSGATLQKQARLVSVERGAGIIRSVTCADGTNHSARIFIDASYEGDLLAGAGCAFHVGREANAVYDETLNGVQLGRPAHNFRVPLDPYRVVGDPSSGLLARIDDRDPGRHGDGDDKIQAYNFRMCLTRNPANRIPFARPDGYDPEQYALLARYINAGVWDALRLSTPMPNGKTDTNNHGGFSTDNIGRNWDYPTGDHETRQRIIAEHITYQQGLMYFLANDPSVPRAVRDEVGAWGLAADEFTGTGGWPHQLYIREARRLVSDYVMTEHDCRGHRVVADGVGLASYTMDSHHVQRVVINGEPRNEGDVQVGVPAPYPVSYRSIRPRRRDCTNLLVPVCASTSHIAYGSIRMEPVFMVLAQAAATAASLALRHRCAVQDIAVDKLQERLLADGATLRWERPSSEPTVATMVKPELLPGITLDDQDATRSAGWHDSQLAASRQVGTGYIHDNNDEKGKTYIAWCPKLPRAGRYRIVMFYVPHANRASRVPVTIAVEGRATVTRRFDQRRTDQNGRADLGIYDLPAGRRTTVTMHNFDTDGYVVADGIAFIPVDETE